MLCIPAMSSIIVSPEANQMTRMQMAVVARPVRTVHAVVALAIPSLDRTKFTLPELGCSSTKAI